VKILLQRDLKRLYMKCKGTDVEMKYKGAVFFDYDGTMADDRIGIHLPTETTKKALKSLSENGYMVVLNSGRSKAALMETGIDFDGYVLMNGAYAEVDGKCYPEKDYHTVYVCEVEKAYVK